MKAIEDVELGPSTAFFAAAIRRLSRKSASGSDEAADEERVAEWRGKIVDALMAAGDAELASEARRLMFEVASMALAAVALDFGNDAASFVELDGESERERVRAILALCVAR